MANPYPADFADDTGQVRLGGEITFTDNANQPGGGSVPGSPHWIGPYTVTFESFDPDNFVLGPVMTPPAGEFLLGAIVKVTDEFVGATGLKVGIGVAANVVLLQPKALSTVIDAGVAGVEQADYQPGNMSAAAVPVVIRTTAVGDNEVWVSIDDVPSAGSADVWLCFVAPEAP